MVRIDDVDYPTVADAAAALKVSTKTVNEWITKGIIAQPEVKTYGTRQIAIFPARYMQDAQKELEAYRSLSKREKSDFSVMSETEKRTFLASRIP